MMLLSRGLHGPVLQFTCGPGKHRSARSELYAVRAQQGQEAQQRAPAVVGMGLCCMDYLAQVASYPQADAKLRSEQLETKSGGNAGNQTSAAAKLGLTASLMTKIGDDGIGDQILSELHEAGVNTQHILREPDHPSPFTYIIVDREGGTRTCIHTPGAPLHEGEVTDDFIDRLLGTATLVSFDGRLTEAAILVAAAARQRGVRVLVEAERVRPHLERLLPLADYVVTSAHFPEEWTGEDSLGGALHAILPHLPNAQWLVTTLGGRGAVLLQRQEGQEASGEPALLDDVVNDLLQRVQEVASSQQSNTVCTSATGVSIGEGHVVSTPGYLHLQTSDGDQAESQRRAKEAAEAEAKRASEAQQSAAFHELVSDGAAAGRPVRVLAASTASLPKDQLADTTGAGDAFIGAMQYAICHHMAPEKALKLAAVVAACKCTEIGARAGQPLRQAIAEHLLS